MASQITSVEKAHGESIFCSTWCAGISNQFVTGSVDGSIKLWEVAELGNPLKEKIKLVATFSESPAAVVSVATCKSKSGSVFLLSSSMDCRIRIWDLKTQKFVREIECGAVECWKLAIHPSGEKVASGTHTGAVNIWNIESGELESTLETKGEFALSLAYNADGSRLAVGDKAGKVYVFEQERLTKTFAAHALPVRSICFSTDSLFVLTSSDDTTVNMYETKTFEQVGTIKGHSSWVMCVTCSPDDQYFATASSDKRVRLWDLKQRNCIQTFESHSDQVYMVCFNDVGSRLVSVGAEGDIYLYKVN
mmetsp:Transcript_10275/g.11808  ORF Transcript_10275/g.11808 Transcript_10275/m.11808 type:complete len:306 (+) Transcript_10275:172-1089(+)|eukprot:CAMPEP_0184030356 /NCGR_PEP_ID=MMETSP0955-20130417/1376_1 /TAXON_ID=627963 /ORGANISM="Aplanochytrium sp, Strain PBS07" /LENGTH=305 /DNA_ID=CAMNT_0026315707 /DNA_START=39 /DNA_END=953 /DNA_ORIENTATION=-